MDCSISHPLSEADGGISPVECIPQQRMYYCKQYKTAISLGCIINFEFYNFILLIDQRLLIQFLQRYDILKILFYYTFKNCCCQNNSSFVTNLEGLFHVLKQKGFEKEFVRLNKSLQDLYQSSFLHEYYGKSGYSLSLLNIFLTVAFGNGTYLDIFLIIIRSKLSSYG